MGLWQGLLIVLGCLVAGLLVGLLIIRLLGHKGGKEYSLLDKETNSIKSAGPKDPLEVLLKNHNNSVVAESPKQPKVIDVPTIAEMAAEKNPPVTAKVEKPVQPVVTNVPGNVEIAVQKNPPVTAKEEKPAQPAIHWTELYPHTVQVEKDENQKPSEPAVLKEPVAVNQKGTLLEGKPDKTVAQGVLRESEIVSDKAARVEEKLKKTAKSSGPKKSETVIREATPEVEDKNTDTKPLVQETAGSIPKIEPVAAKPENTLKSELVMEIEANLAVARKPWEDKLYSFQTECWDSKHGESDLFLNNHYQDLIQLYVDISLANNIVWLATEINHRSKELDESYIKLCSSIATNIKKVLS